MQELSRKAIPNSADEWKRKFLTESKVNQELGRRLRNLKDKLQEEQACVEQLQLQIETLNTSQSQGIMDGVACSKCADLERELARLRSLLREHNIDADTKQQYSHEGLPSLRLEIAEAANPLRRSHSILIRRESGRIQCLRDVLDDLTPPTNMIESARRNSRISRASPGTPMGTPESKQATVSKEDTTDRFKVICGSQDGAKEKKQESTNLGANNQDPETSLSEVNTLNGIEDKSLGDLFKYAIVLAGPMSKPKKSALSAFFKNSDFRRAKATLDGSSMTGEGSTIRKLSIVSSSNDKSSTGASKAAEQPLQKPAVSNVTPLAFAQQDIVSADTNRTKSGEVSKAPPPGSPMKRPGWLSSIVPPRFRSGGNEAPPSPQARLTETSNDTSEQMTSSKPVVSQPLAKFYPTKPRMLAVSPSPGKEGVAELEGLLELCFPYGQKLPPLSDFSVANLRRTLQERHRTYRSPDSTFVLTIASVKNPTEITYAVCVHMPLFPDDDSGTGPENIDAEGEKLPAHGCISLLSNYPFFSLFFKVVFGIASIWESRRKEYVQDYAIALKEKKAPPVALTIRDFVEHFDGVMNRMKDMRVPAMGGWTRLLLAPQYTPLSFHRPHSENVTAERRMLVLEYAAPMLFAQLSVDQVLFLLGCLCCERKVLVVSDHANIVSSCVLALITLLEPLQWAGPVVTLLPPRLDELLEAPVPLIAGRVSVNSGYIPNFSTLTKPMNGVIEMNMDQNNLCMHEEDLMLYHELKLPGCDALVHELQHFSSLLFERHLTPEFPTLEQIQACESICSRIHRHMQSICSLATGEATTLDVSSPLYCTSPRRQATGPTSDPVWTRRCSEAVQDYIRRFQETQMFTMLKLQRQEERADADDDDNDDDDDDDDIPNKRGADARVDSSDEDDDGGVTLVVEEDAVTYATLR